MNEETPTRITQLWTVGVPVTDHERAREFSVDKLGFEQRTDFTFGEGERWIEVVPRGATTTIALVSTRGGVPAGVETGIRLATEDAEADHSALRARGVDVDEENMRMGDYVPPMFYVRDPDGNRLVIVEAR